MIKKGKMILATACYLAGVFASIYVGGWLMLIVPIQELMSAFSAETITWNFVVVCILKILFSTTFAGLVWCIGYIGYNYFRGTDDPDWESMDKEL